MHFQSQGRFLGLYLTGRGIKTKTDKCRAVIVMEPFSSKEDIMKLNGMLTTLSIFISKSAQHTLPFFKILRKESNIEWTSEYEEVFNKLKDILSQPPVLSKPMVREILLLYLPISAEAVSAVLVREIGTNQCLVYFCSKALAGAETRYKKIEKVSLTFMVAAGN
jgi:hypothetical protein